MADDVCAEPQLRSALGLYLAGALQDAECAAIESHLGTCAQCLADAERVGEAVAMLALLTETDRRELVAEFGVSGTRPPDQNQELAAVRPEPVLPVPVTPESVVLELSSPETVVPEPVLPELVSPELVSPDREPASGSSVPNSGATAGTTRPIANRPPSGPGGQAGPGRRRRRPRVALIAGGLAVVVLLSVGLLLGRSVVGGSRGADPVTLVANAQDSSTGATLAVTVTGQQEPVTLRATVGGLHPGEPYQVFVTDVTGQSWEMAVLTGGDHPQEVARASPVPLVQLASFSVTASDGSLAVTAVVDRVSSSGSPD
ncbi:zf-HC2 domain-containing protein [Actinoplanes derwentensis]|uniref:Putative zinc-finger n=1 Tax=Actinoplanes derwentensis TaxID=113562 RepID=A0A1H2C8Y0_9ACTN|nr:zf-HC2 domain-containing protein [Actinoplanes derwentensis]GID86541.1 hypothetical protein Ade03nite_54650 [Actinoplanes derwentensis]SDT66526.1 Putative zinc-finger [Actinoplanes derwentensis]